MVRATDQWSPTGQRQLQTTVVKETLGNRNGRALKERNNTENFTEFSE
jgi:hypothetical protein